MTTRPNESSFASSPLATPARARTGRAALAVAASLLVAIPSLADVTLDLHLGVAGAVHGDAPDDLDLGPGLGGGLSLGFSIGEGLALEVRYDGMGLRGEEGLSAFGAAIEGSGQVDTRGQTHGLTAGPSLRFGDDGIELYLGAHPGVYFSELKIDQSASIGDVNLNRGFVSDTSTDFGVNARAGVRFFIGDTFFIGPDLAYHYVMIRDEADDDLGILLGSVALGGRF